MRMLVVDDEAEIADMLAEFFMREGFVVTCANCGSVALVAAPRGFDIILLVVNMPGMDGFEVCRRLKENHETEPNPVLFLSVMEAPGQKHHGFEVGGVDYVTKPFHADEVLARVRTHVTIKRLRE